MLWRSNITDLLHICGTLCCWRRRMYQWFLLQWRFSLWFWQLWYFARIHSRCHILHTTTTGLDFLHLSLWSEINIINLPFVIFKITDAACKNIITAEASLLPQRAARRLVNARKVRVIAHLIQFVATVLNVEYKTAITH